MSRKPSTPDGSLAEWLETEGIVPAADPAALKDLPRIRTLLLEAARAGHSVSYSEMLGQLGFRFTRPKMRTLCRSLDAIDETGRAAGEPELAVLVVRESDRLPGQGWWVGVADRLGYTGAWEGKGALRFIEGVQQRAFDYWQGR